MKSLFAIVIITVTVLLGGQVSAANLFYTVKEKDTLWSIGQKTGYSVENLLDMNCDIDPATCRIFPGQKINLMPASITGGEKIIQNKDEKIIIDLMRSTTQKYDQFNEREYEKVERLMNDYLNTMGNNMVDLSCLRINNYAKRVMRLTNALRSLHIKKDQCPSCCYFDEDSLVVLVLHDKLFLLLGATFSEKYNKSISGEIKKEIRTNVGQREIFQHIYSAVVYHE